MMSRVIEAYFHLLKGLIALCLAIMVVLVFGNVVLRYGFNTGITISEEVSRWLFVYLTFLGAIVALREHGHLGVDSLVVRLPVIGKKICLIVSQLLMIMDLLAVPARKLGADDDQHGRRGARVGRVGRHLLRRRRDLQRLGVVHPSLRVLDGA